MDSTATTSKSQNAVSSTAVQKVACEKCHSENPSSRRFCGDCGHTLWRQCAACDQENAAVDVFCGHCGADQSQLHERSRNQIKAALEQAQKFADGHRFETAVATLRPYRSSSDNRLEPLTRAVRQHIAHFQELAEKGKLDAESASELAERLLSEHDYNKALETLTAVPSPLHDEPFRKLLARATDLCDQVRALNHRIPEALGANDLADLALCVEQLLALQPEDKRAKELAARLGDRFMKKAERRLAEHRYAEAVEVLDHTPTLARSTAFEKLRARAAELECLLDELQHGAFADNTLTKLGDRLVKLAPTCKEAIQLRQQIQQRRDGSSKSPISGAVDWYAPEGGRFGVTVEWWARPNRLRIAKTGADAFAAKPGQLFVACGLAIQGLGAAHVATNLLPDASRRKGMFDRIVSLHKKSNATSAWGIDIGSSALKAVRMVREPDDQMTVAEAVVIEYSRQNETHERDAWRSSVERSLKTFSEGKDFGNERAVVGISGQQVLGRFFTLPPVAAKRRIDAITYEARNSIPFPMEEVVWDYRIFDEPSESSDEDSKPYQVMVVAAKRHHASELLSMCNDAGLNVAVMQCDSIALHNAARHALPLGESDESANSPSVIGMIDVGSQSTNFVASWPDGLWFRSFGVGGENFSQALVQGFKLTRQQAELIKREPIRVKRFSAFYDTVAPEFERWLREIERSTESYGKLYPANPMDKLYGVGGAFQLHGLLRQLRKPTSQK